MALTPSAEYHLLQLIARAELSPERVAAFRERAGDVEWEAVLELAAYHRLVSLLYVHIRDHASDLAPDDVQTVLRNTAMSRTVQVLFLSSEMKRIAMRLEQDGIPFLVLKGPSLAEAFGDMSRRPFVDNDLLVRRADFKQVGEALIDIGFNHRKRGPLQTAGYLFVHGEYTFGRAIGTQISTADIHTDLVPVGYPYQVSFETLLSRSRPLEMAGMPVPVLSWEDLFIALCVNALKDQWNRLRLASDLAEVGTLVDWSIVQERARRGRCRRAVRLAVLVSVDEVDAEFPEAVVADARSDARAVDLAEQVRLHFRTFHEAHVLEGKDRARLNLLAQDDIRAQIRYSSYVALRRMTEWFVDPAETA